MKDPAYEALLRNVESMTEDDLAANVAALPAEVRAALAQGPLPYRYDCRVCKAMPECRHGVPDASDPIWRVFGYHEVPKLRMKHANDQWYGALATEVHDRCMTIYRLASTGEDNDE